MRARRRETRMKSKGIAVPYVIWMAIFVVAPLLIIVFYAFTSQAGGFTLENFSTMAQYTGVFGRSFLLAIIATFICLLIGYPLSYWLAQESPAVRRVAMMLIMLPMWMNFLLRTYSWMFLLEKRGLINSFLGLFGIGPFQLINTQGAVVLGMVYNFLPFMILPILSVLEKIDPPNPEKLLFDIPVPGPMLATTEDCVVDDRGYIYMDTWHDGMYILRMKEDNKN